MVLCEEQPNTPHTQTLIHTLNKAKQSKWNHNKNQKIQLWPFDDYQ